MPPLASIDTRDIRCLAALHDDLTRRRFLAGMAASAGLLTGCASSTEPAPPAEGPWNFTDDRGVTVTRESRPQRVVAYERSAAALLGLGVKPIGTFAPTRLAKSQALSGFDLSGIESVGETYGEIDLEKLAALRPEVIVAPFSPGQTRLTGIDNEIQDEVQALAPIIAIERRLDLTDTIARYEELAASLGADLEAPAVVAARQRFDQAGEELRAVASKPGLLTVAMSAIAGKGIYFYRPTTVSILRHLRQLGLALVDPEGATNDMNSGNYELEKVSFEQANKYPADLILHDSSSTQMSLDELATIPTWQALPAVQAGQIAPWRGIENWSYRHYAEDIERITDAVKRADPNIVS